MHVAVCIVGFRNPDDVSDCLAALATCAHADFEVVICENGGPAAFVALERAIPGRLSSGQVVRLIEASGNLGYAGGINVCMRATPEADAWWILNPDTQPDPMALTHLCATLSQGGFAAVGSTVHYPDGRVESRGGRWNAWLARAVSIDHGLALARAPSEGATITYLSGASMLVGRDFVDRVGLMREDYFLYAEEVEWCLRAVQQGLRLGVAPEAHVLHQQGTTTGSVPQIERRGRISVYLDERNKLLVTRDRYPHRLPVAAVAAFALLCLRFGRRAAWRQLGYALDGWWAGLRGLRGAPAWIPA